MRADSLRPKSLAEQIREAERQVSNRRLRVGVRAATLARQARQQMTAPASLLLAGGVGFILGELTRRQTPKAHGNIGQPRAAATTPLRTALNLITTAHTLYTALPLAWLMKSHSGAHSNAEQNPSPPPEPSSHVRPPSLGLQ